MEFKYEKSRAKEETEDGTPGLRGDAAAEKAFGLSERADGENDWVEPFEVPEFGKIEANGRWFRP